MSSFAEEFSFLCALVENASWANGLLESILTEDSKDPGPSPGSDITNCATLPSNMTFLDLGLHKWKTSGLLDYLKYPFWLHYSESKL